MYKQGIIYDTLVGGKKNPYNLTYLPTKSLVRGEDSDGEVFRANVETNALDHDNVDSYSNPYIEGEVDIVEDGALNLLVEDGALNLLVEECETRDAMLTPNACECQNWQTSSVFINFEYKSNGFCKYGKGEYVGMGWGRTIMI